MALFGRIEDTTHSGRRALAFLTLGGRAPMVCGVPSGSGADGVAWSAPDRVARCLIGRGVPVFFLLFFLLAVPEDGRRLPSLQGVRFLVLSFRAYYIIIR